MYFNLKKISLGEKPSYLSLVPCYLSLTSKLLFDLQLARLHHFFLIIDIRVVSIVIKLN